MLRNYFRNWFKPEPNYRITESIYGSGLTEYRVQSRHLQEGIVFWLDLTIEDSLEVAEKRLHEIMDARHQIKVVSEKVVGEW